jgi:hypothetical protein
LLINFGLYFDDILSDNDDERVFLCVWVQDNVFVQLICSIQYRVVKENADDAFYELQNPQEQIQAYVFDGLCFSLVFIYHFGCFSMGLYVC